MELFIHGLNRPHQSAAFGLSAAPAQPPEIFLEVPMFVCCVGSNDEPGEVVETKAQAVLEHKGTQSVEPNEQSGIFTVTVPAKRHATLGLETCAKE